MAFWGADTEQLRNLAEQGRSLLSGLAERRNTADSLVRSVPWEGPDADSFQEQWAQVTSRWDGVQKRAATVCAELIQHAQEQDDASESDGTPGAPLGPRVETDGPARPGPGKKPVLGPLVQTDGPADSSDSSYARPPLLKPPSEDPLANPLLRKPDQPHSFTRDDPSDEFGHARGGDDHHEETTTATADSDDGSASVSESSKDGDRTETLKGERTWTDAEGKAGSDRSGGEVALKHTLGEEISKTTHPDGSVTYKTTETVSQASESSASADDGREQGGVSASDTRSMSYTKEVTVPKGTSEDAALKADPMHPETMPKGSTITVSDVSSHGDAADLYAQWKKGPRATFGGSETQSDEHATTYMKDKDGALTLETGDKRTVEQETHFKLGWQDKLDVGFANSTADEHGNIDHVKFSNDAAGQRAYHDAISSGKLPGQGADGTEERWRDIRDSTNGKHTSSLHLGPVQHDSSKNTYSDEVIMRDYLNGQHDYARQVLPQGDGSKDYVLETGGTGRAPTYRVHMGNPNNEGAEYLKDYWHTDGRSGQATLEFSDAEAQRMMHNAQARPQADYSNPTDYFARVSAREHNMSGGKGFDTLWKDYQGGWTGNGMYTGPQDGPAPGKVVKD